MGKETGMRDVKDLELVGLRDLSRAQMVGGLGLVRTWTQGQGCKQEWETEPAAFDVGIQVLRGGEMESALEPALGILCRNTRSLHAQGDKVERERGKELPARHLSLPRSVSFAPCTGAVKIVGWLCTALYLAAGNWVDHYSMWIHVL